MPDFIDIRVQSEAFDPGAELNRFSAACKGAGAVVSFSGLVRDEAGQLLGLEIEHYPAMTDKALADIAAMACSRWDLGGVFILHRYGVLAVGEPIMMVATASLHRQDAFLAADFLMDYLKSQAPFWKKQISAQGGEWVAAKQSDEQALSRWSPELL